jgi:heptaprenyl diphosphate synthase
MGREVACVSSQSGAAFAPTQSPLSQRTALRARLALYAAAAALLFLIERWLPNPLPWVRLGLANVVTLVVLLEHGAGAALAVLWLRLLLAAFFAGSFLGPQFLLSVAGGMTSWALMAAGARLGGRVWSALGLSLLGAAGHALSQLVVVHWLFAPGGAVWALVPLFLALAIATGCITGCCAEAVLRRLDLVAAPHAGRAP